MWSGRLPALVAAGAVTASVLGAGMLAGCSLTSGRELVTSTGTELTIPGFRIRGNVHGGAYPIQNATVRLMETTSTGTWNTATLSYTGTARQILSTTSNSSGYFTFPDTGWSCTPGQYDYIEVNGGHTTSSTNPNVVQVGVIGACSTDLANQAEIDGVDVWISEPSTVAAAYALNSFISLSTDSTGAPVVNITAPANNNSATPKCSGTRATGLTALNCTAAGLAHAFANAYNLVDQVTFSAGQFPTGQARATLPGNSQAVAPQAMVNTLGNILQSCVDSTGGTVANYATYVPGGTGSSRCGDLFYDSTAPGSTTPPTNTMQSILNIANYPTHNALPLFQLQPRAVFFTPDMPSGTYNGTTTPVAFTLSVFYAGTGLSSDTTGLVNPVDVALDVQDNVYVAYTKASLVGALDEFSANGTGVFSAVPTSAIPNPATVAIDANDYAWISDNTALTGGVTGFYTSASTPANASLWGSTYKSVTVPYGSASGLAFDAYSDMYVTRNASANPTDYFYTLAGSTYTRAFTGSTLGAPLQKASVDALGNFKAVGTVNGASSVAIMVAQTFGTNYCDTATHFSATGVTSIATDNTTGNYVLYLPFSGSVTTGNANGSAGLQGNGTTCSNASTSVSSAGTYTETATSSQPTSPNPNGAALDGSRNLFWTDSSNGQVYYLKGTGGSTNIANGGTFGSFMPCHLTAGVCDNVASAKLGGMAIDSSGTLWYISAGGYGLVQTLGIASPTWPLLAAEDSGITVQ